MKIMIIALMPMLACSQDLREENCRTSCKDRGYKYTQGYDQGGGIVRVCKCEETTRCEK